MSAPIENARPLRLLVIEKADRRRELLKHRLQEVGYDVIACDGAKDAPADSEGEPYSVVVVGLEPASDWSGIIHDLRQRIPNSRIVAYARQPALESVQSALAAGLFAFVEEQSDLTELITSIEHAREKWPPPDSARQHGMDSLLEHAVDPYFVHDQYGRILDVNRAACNSLGYTRSELLTLSIFDIEIGVDPNKLIENWINGVAGESAAIEGIHRRKDGTTFPVEVCVGLVDEGPSRIFLAAARDITERRQADETIRLRDRCLESASSGIIITDACRPDQPIVYCNRGFQRITGYSEEEILGRNCRFLQRDDQDQKGIVPIRNAIRDGTSAHSILRNYRKDGRLFWNELSINPVRNADGVVTHYVGSINDITQQKQAAALLAGERSVLTLIATRASLTRVLTALAESIQSQIPDGMVVVMLADESGTTLRLTASAGIADEFLTEIESLPIDDEQNPISRAAQQRRRIEVAELEQSSLTSNCFHSARRTGIEACTTIPVLDANHFLLGTLTLFASSVGFPESYQLKILEAAAQLIDIAVTRRREELQLRSSEEQFRLLAENARDIVFRFRFYPQPRLEYVSPAVAQITGHHPEQLYTDQVLARSLFHIEEADDDSGETFGTSTSRVDRWVRADGFEVWLEQHTVPSYDQQGQIKYVEGISRDITQRHNVEKALQRSNRLLEVVTAVQSAYIAHEERANPFADLLSHTLEITESEFGCVGSVFWESGRPHVKMLWMADCHHDESPDAQEPAFTSSIEAETNDLDSLLGDVVTSGNAILYNNSAEEPRRLGISGSRLALKSFLGLPVYSGARLLGVIGLVNRDGGYDEEMTGFLKPLLATCGSLIGAQRSAEKRRHAEDALRESEERYRVLAEYSTDLICRHDEEGVFRYVSPAAMQLLGRDRDDLIGQSVFDFICENDADQVSRSFRNQRADKRIETVEFRMRHKDGHYVWMEANGQFVVDETTGEVLEIVTVARDITTRKQTEHELQVSKKRYQQLLDTMTEGVGVSDIEGEFIYVNDRLCEMLGVRRSDLLGSRIADYLEESSQARFASQAAATDSTARTACELVWKSTDGTLRPTLTSSREIVDGRDDENAVLNVMTDITAHKQVESELLEERNFVSAVLDTVDALVVVLSPDGCIVRFNHATSRTTGYEVEDVAGRPFWECLGAEDEIAAVQKAFGDLCEGELPVSFEVDCVAKNGERQRIAWSNTIIADPGGRVEHIICTGINVTGLREAELEQRRLESQFRHAQKLESLGVLAGGIAHDFNNLLMGVLGNASLSLMELDPDSPVRENIERIEAAAQRAADLCKQMLAYSGKGRFVVEPIDLNRIVTEITHLLETVVSKRAELRVTLAGDLPLIEADAAQLTQVIMNLITNASDALTEESGIVAVRTGVLDADAEYLGTTYFDDNLESGRYAFIEVADTGCGMDEETRQRIFDPFFSTKFTGRGLGLAAVLGIVRGHGGAISVESRQNVGSVFRVLFPATVKVGVDEPRRLPSAEPPPAKGTVLVVDDEPAVRLVTKKTLERAGFEVMTANDGKEGVDVFKKHAGEISAVLLDLTMPNLNGEEAFREMRRIRLDIPVVLSSGFDEQEATGHVHEEGLAGFIQKPYRPQALIDKMRQTISLQRDD